MKFVKKEILEKFDTKNIERRKRLGAFIKEIQAKLRPVKLKNSITLEIELSASNSTLHHNRSRSHGDYARWRTIREHCATLKLNSSYHFGILTDGRVAVNIAVKGEKDFCSVADIVSEYKLSGYAEDNNFLYIIERDIILFFWYRL